MPKKLFEKVKKVLPFKNGKLNVLFTGYIRAQNKFVEDRNDIAIVHRDWQLLPTLEARVEASVRFSGPFLGIPPALLNVFFEPSAKVQARLGGRHDFVDGRLQEDSVRFTLQLELTAFLGAQVALGLAEFSAGVGAIANGWVDVVLQDAKKHDARGRAGYSIGPAFLAYRATALWGTIEVQDRIPVTDAFTDSTDSNRPFGDGLTNPQTGDEY